MAAFANSPRTNKTPNKALWHGNLLSAIQMLSLPRPPARIQSLFKSKKVSDKVSFCALSCKTIGQIESNENQNTPFLKSTEMPYVSHIDRKHFLGGDTQILWKFSPQGKASCEGKGIQERKPRPHLSFLRVFSSL